MSYEARAFPQGLNRLRKNSISQKVRKMDRVRMPQERSEGPRRRFSITNSEGILTPYRVFPQPVKPALIPRGLSARLKSWPKKKQDRKLLKIRRGIIVLAIPP